jgi:hypothetical protein
VSYSFSTTNASNPPARNPLKTELSRSPETCGAISTAEQKRRDQRRALDDLHDKPSRFGMVLCAWRHWPILTLHLRNLVPSPAVNGPDAARFGGTRKLGVQFQPLSKGTELP